jgi:hypothetical protein
MRDFVETVQNMQMWELVEIMHECRNSQIVE